MSNYCNKCVNICYPYKAICPTPLCCQCKSINYCPTGCAPPYDPCGQWNNCGGCCCRNGRYEDDRSSKSESNSDRNHERKRFKRCDKCDRRDCECVEYYPCLRTKCGFISATLTKSASLDFFIVAGQIVAYSYTITNTGNVAICYPIQICDDRLGGWNIPCSYIPPGGSQTFTRTYTITAADVEAQSITNTATAYIQVKRCKWVCAQAINNTVTITFGNADVFGSLSQVGTGTNGDASSAVVTVNIGNLASSQTNAFGVNFFIPYPANVNSGSISGATATLPANQPSIGANGITISELTIPVGTTYIYRFTYTPALPGAYTWSGIVTTSSFDPNLANNEVGPNTFIIG